MMRPQFRFLVWTVLTYLLPFANSQACNSSALPVIRNQDGANSMYDGCTEIIGDIVISSEYSGRLTLKNVTKINGNIRLENATIINLYLDLFMDNLKEVGNITIESKNLGNFSFKSLERVDTLKFVSGKSRAYFMFPALKTASSISINGTIEGLNFDQLSSVDLGLEIFADNYVPETSFSAERMAAPPLSVDLPLLKRVSYLEIGGNITSVDLAYLQVAAMNSSTYNNPDIIARKKVSGVSISTSGPAISNLRLPTLYNATNLLLAGGFGNFYIPALTTIDGNYSLDASLTTFADLNFLHSVDSISIRGWIINYDVSALEHVGTSMFLTSSLHVDCIGFLEKGQFIKANGNTTLTCMSAPYTYTSNPKIAKLPIGLGVGLGTSALLILLYLGYRWNRKGGSNWKPSEEELHELNERNRVRTPDAEPLPIYEPRRDSAGGGGGGGGVGAAAIETTFPSTALTRNTPSHDIERRTPTSHGDGRISPIGPVEDDRERDSPPKYNMMPPGRVLRAAIRRQEVEKSINESH